MNSLPDQQIQMPPDLDGRLARIDELSRTVSRSIDNVYVPLGCEISDVEWYSIAAIKKMASHCHAFCLLVRTRNTLTATAMVRLQLDTAMRVFGLSLVDDVEDTGSRLMNGESYRRLKSRSGEPLHDAYLHSELTKSYPWVSRVYNDSSAFVHLSGQHIATGIVGIGEKLYFHPYGTDDSRDDEYYLGIAETFIFASQLASDLIQAFLDTRPSSEERSAIMLAKRDGNASR